MVDDAGVSNSNIAKGRSGRASRARRERKKPEQPAGLTDPAPPVPLKDSADNLDALRAAIDSAASDTGTLWLSYLFPLFYLALAAGGITHGDDGITHGDLPLENPVQLPFLNINLPLIGFAWLGPALFVVVHAYVLLQFLLLAEKIGAFDAQLRVQVNNPETRAKLRLQLPSNLFVQALSGAREVWGGLCGTLLWLVAWISLIIGPIALLVFFELQFLQYHDPAISWWQRAMAVTDLGLLWLLWPAIARGESISTAWSWMVHNVATGGRSLAARFGGMFRSPVGQGMAGQPARGSSTTFKRAAFGRAARRTLAAPLAAISAVLVGLVLVVATFPASH